MKNKTLQISFLIFVVITLVLFWFTENKMFAIVDNTPLTLENYKKVFSSIYIWNSFLSAPSATESVLNYNTYFIALSELFSLSVTQLIVAIKCTSYFLAFIGIYLWVKRLNDIYFKNEIPSTAIILGSIIYIVNPTFFIGDHFWVGIQVGYYLSPLVGYYSFSYFTERKIKYLCLLLIALSVNTAGHFIYGGFILIIIFSWMLYFILSKNKISTIKIGLIDFIIFTALYAIALAPQIVGISQTVSEAATYLTRESVSNPWSGSYIYNMIRGMTFTNLPQDYYVFTESPIKIFFYFFTFSPILIIIYSVLCRRGKIFSVGENNINKTYIYFLFIILFVLSIFSVNGPLKELHYYITLNFPLGKIFRTWRVPETILWMNISLILPIALYYIKSSLNKKRLILSYLILSLGFISLFSPIFFGKINGILINTPNQYLNIFSDIKAKNYEKVIFSPEMAASYGADAPLKPYWSPDTGVVMEFLGYSSPLASIIPSDTLRHFYFFTVSEFFGKTGNLIQNKEYFALSRMLGFNNIKYLIIRNDSNTILKEKNVLNDLKESMDWGLKKSVENLYLFENKYSSNHISLFDKSHTLLVNGGYRVMINFLNRNKVNSDNFLMIFSDQNIKQIDYTKLSVVNDKNQQDVINNLLISILKTEKLSPYFNLIFPSTILRRHDPENVWSTGNLQDIHQTEWHPYVNIMNGYAWDFDFNKGYIFTINNKDTVEMPLTNLKSGDYKILIRYLSNNAGGSFSIKNTDNDINIDSRGDYNGFVWATYDYNQINNNTFSISNLSGFNAISAILIIEKNLYEKEKSKIKKNLENMEVYEVSPDIKNTLIDGRFETESTSNWELIKNKSLYTVTKSQDSLDGTSIQISTNTTREEWSWYGSPWVTVKPNTKYQFRTSMKNLGAMNSHIVLLGYNPITNKEIQLSQLPNATSEKTDWLNYKRDVFIPENITKVRVLLNAGWSKDGQFTSTLFDNIFLIPLEFENTDNLPPINNSCKIKYFEINPTEWDIIVPSICGKNFYLSLNERYNEGWNAQYKTKNNTYIEIDKGYQIMANGFANAWEINIEKINLYKDVNNNYTFRFKFKPQKSFFASQMVTIFAVLTCLGYLGYDFMRRKSRSKVIRS